MKKLVVLLLSVVLFTLPATTIFAQDAYEDNDSWFTAKPIFQGKTVYGTFHDNPDPDFYYFTANPYFSTQNVLFVPPDNQDYFVGVYRLEDWAAGGSVSAVAYQYVTGGQIAQFSFTPQIGVIYTILVMGMNYNTYPTGTYTLHIWPF